MRLRRSRLCLPNCATADRFEDDIHWMGGALLTDSLEWGATAIHSLLPTPIPWAKTGTQSGMTGPSRSPFRLKTGPGMTAAGHIGAMALLYLMQTSCLARCSILAAGQTVANSVMRLVAARLISATALSGHGGIITLIRVTPGRPSFPKSGA